MAPWEDSLPVPLAPQLSEDKKALHAGFPLAAIVDDPNPPETPRRVQAPAWMKDLREEAATAAFSITYVPSGGTDPWGEACYTFPPAAKAAFNAAARIWGNLLKSSTPITISACWANMGSSSILGYSGGGPLWRDFSGVPQANTWYGSSLANALHGSDLDPARFDMHITYNQVFNWYLGTDGNPPVSQHDFMTVVLHEICHGLNFSGSMSYSSGTGSWGYGTGYPNIYDVFVKDGAGKSLLTYVNGSTALGTALRSNNLWLHGPTAMAANGGQRVRIYAPSTWSSGSSYSHLDYSTFNNTPNQLMVYAISAGESVHDPGPVTTDLLEDLGWPVGTSPPPPGIPAVSLDFLPLLLDGSTTSSCPAIPNGDFESGAVDWTEFSELGRDRIGQWGEVTAHSGTWYTWLGGENSETAYVQQLVTVSAPCPYLVFYHWVRSSDACGYDYGYVKINGTNVSTLPLCSIENTGGWVKKSINLSGYINQTVSLQIRAETDFSFSSDWFIDDVSFQP